MSVLQFTPQSQGHFFGFGVVKRPANKYVQYEFHEEVVLNGIRITTYQGHGLRRLRIRANNDLNNPHLLTMKNPIMRNNLVILQNILQNRNIYFLAQPFYVCYLERLADCDDLMEAGGGLMSQTFYFTQPFPTTKVRLDEFDGAPEIAFAVEFLGLDRNKRNLMSNPMTGGYITTSNDLHYLSSLTA